MERLTGLIAAAYTPMDDRGAVKTEGVAPLVRHLLNSGVNGLYVCGSTGEGVSLSTEERIELTKAFVNEVAGRVPVIVQVGHNSVAEAKRLAAAAQDAGADAISATCPSYFKVTDLQMLAATMAEVAAGAPELPFYYYHIPVLTGSAIDMPEFLTHAATQIPNLVGLKYTDTKLHEFLECQQLQDGRFDVVWGCDEMFLGALATGTLGAIGSTYNIAAPLYKKLQQAFEAGDLNEARRLQGLSVSMIRILAKRPFHSAMKAVLGMQGINVGRCRLPQAKLSAADVTTLRTELEAIGFFEWSQAK